MLKPRPLDSSHPMSKLNVGALPAAPARTRSQGEGVARSLTPNKPGHINDPIPTVPGQRRQTSGNVANSFHHGIAVDDEPNTTPTHEQGIRVHAAMSPRQVAAHAKSPSANAVLTDAANMSRKA